MTEKLLDEFNLQHLRTLKCICFIWRRNKRLMMARIMINKPKIVLLMNLFCIRSISNSRYAKIYFKNSIYGTAILLTDHNVSNLFDITDRNYVFGEQTIIAEGTKREIIKIFKSN